MQKVKVQRYISGKRPEYAQYKSSDEESETEDFIDRRAQRSFANRGDDSYDASRKRNTHDTSDAYKSDDAADDPRLRRLARRHHVASDSDKDKSEDEDQQDRERRLRRVRERVVPEILESDKEEVYGSEGEVESENEPVPQQQYNDAVDIERKRRIELDDTSGSDSELSDAEIEDRRQRLKNKYLNIFFLC